jgi:hypothetical protein
MGHWLCLGQYCFHDSSLEGLANSVCIKQSGNKFSDTTYVADNFLSVGEELFEGCG